MPDTDSKTKDEQISAAFKADNHLRCAERCCFNCKHGDVDCEGENDCQHPHLAYRDEFDETTHARVWAPGWSVCDLWESKEARA